MTMLSLLKIPSGDAMMVGRLFTPEGVGPHPTLLLLHGFPGAQQNHDLAIAHDRKSAAETRKIDARQAHGINQALPAISMKAGISSPNPTGVGPSS